MYHSINVGRRHAREVECSGSGRAKSLSAYVATDLLSAARPYSAAGTGAAAAVCSVSHGVGYKDRVTQTYIISNNVEVVHRHGGRH